MNRKAFYFDLLERTAWTAVQAGGAAFLAAGTNLGLAAKVAGLAALAAAVKALAASKLPWTASDSGSTLPAQLDPPTEPEVVHAVVEPLDVPAPPRLRPLRARRRE